MGNLKLLDVLIGLVLMMAIVSLSASTILEAYSGIIKKRAKGLEETLDRLLGELGSARSTMTIDALTTRPAVRLPFRNMDEPGFPSYVSGAAFVDAVRELSQPPVAEGSAAEKAAAKKGHKETVEASPLAQRLALAGHSLQDETDDAREALQHVFDESMERLSGAYKRWTSFWLFLIGLAIAVVGNVSIFRAAESLWSDGVAREAVTAAAEHVTADDGEGDTGDAVGIDTSDLRSIDATVDELQEDGLPVGWTDEAKAEWAWKFTWGRVGIVIGWLITAMLVTLGAPFYFDLLGNLVSLRSANKGASAADEKKEPGEKSGK